MSEEVKDTIKNDALYQEAVELTKSNTNPPSVAYVQRKLQIGYNRAARLMEAMEYEGIVSTIQSDGSRKLIKPDGVVAIPSEVEQRLEALRLNAFAKLEEARSAMHSYATECEVGPERTRAFDVYENLRRASCI